MGRRRARPQGQPGGQAPGKVPQAAPSGGLWGQGRPELWALLAFGLGAAVALGWIYLLMRPGGAGPVWFYGQGRFLAVLIALALALVGVIVGLTRRPFLDRRRPQAFGVLLLVVGAAPFPVPYPSSREFRPSAVPFQVPAEGTWRVVWGGDGGSGPLAHLPSRRWGLCLTREGPDGRRETVEGKAPGARDFQAFGQPVLSPAAGLVVAAEDGAPDRDPGAPRRGAPAGNHVVIEVAPGEFAVLAHLQEGSLEVAAGDAVVAGQILGRVGASGSGALWAEPHLSAHLQTAPVPFAGEAIPWTFRGYSLNGVPIAAGLPKGGVALDGTLEGQLIEQAIGPSGE